MAVKVKKSSPTSDHPAPEEQESSNIYRVALKADSLLAVNQPLEIEDEFRSLYEGAKNEKLIIQPPFNPQTLASICFRNNILMQCIHAMEVNVDGTGHTIELNEGEEEEETQPKETTAGEDKPNNLDDGGNPVTKVQKANGKLQQKVDPEKKRAEDFFKEPYPGMSFVTMRRHLRVDLEQLGYGYLEVIRNAADEVVFIRWIRGITVRMIRLDQPVEVEKTIQRGGKDFTARMLMRERKFVQRVSQKLLWYKEFGCERDLDKTTGEWVKDGDPRISPEKRASELLMFQVDLDVQTPYGIPRWINNTPAAIGSRKAEEFNLEFFDAGGMPPAIIFIQGGSLTTTTKDQLLMHLAGGKERKHQRAAVVEIQSSSGTLDATNKVDVDVERFGDAKMNDSLFQKYDLQCEEHIQQAFRLPSLFLGKADQANYATAVISYQVAEAQVFGPERLKFDEIVNATVMKALGIKKYHFKSNPVVLQNPDLQMKALDAGKDKINPEEHISKLNQLSGLDMQHDPQVVEENKQLKMGTHPAQLAKAKDERAHAEKIIGVKAGASKLMAGQFKSKRPDAGQGKAYGNASVTVNKEDSTMDYNDIGDLVDSWMHANNLIPNFGEVTEEDRREVVSKVDALPPEDAAIFSALLSVRTFDANNDVGGMVEITDVCKELVDHDHLTH